MGLLAEEGDEQVGVKSKYNTPASQYRMSAEMNVMKLLVKAR